MNETQTINHLNSLIRSRHPIIYINTYEEDRIIKVIHQLCVNASSTWQLVSWDITGIVQELYGENLSIPDDELNQLEILNWFEDTSLPKDATRLLILKDFHNAMGIDSRGGLEYLISRKLRNLCSVLPQQNKSLIIIAPDLYIPPELDKDITVIDWDYPDKDQIAALIENTLKAVSKNTKIKNRFRIDYSEEEKQNIVRAFQGLTLDEITMAIKYILSTQSEFDPSDIIQYKKSIIQKTGMLEWIDTPYDLNAVGGLNNLKDWLGKRKKAFTQEAIDYGLPENPKGLLLLGIQGCGKSMCAKAVAKHWNMPLLRLDIGRMFNGILGSSESNVRHAIKIAESIAPCLLWVDELDKGFAGLSSSGTTDGGTAARVFGSFYTWMQEKNKPVYIVATANNITKLPPELLRKGRFDEIFWVDLPNETERSEIFSIQLQQRKREVANFDLDALARASFGFSGSEIEAAIDDALHESFSDNQRDLTTNDILKSITNTFPLSKIMAEELNKQREWAKNRTRNATLENVKKKKQTKNTIDTDIGIIEPSMDYNKSLELQDDDEL